MTKWTYCSSRVFDWHGTTHHQCRKALCHRVTQGWQHFWGYSIHNDTSQRWFNTKWYWIIQWYTQLYMFILADSDPAGAACKAGCWVWLGVLTVLSVLVWAVMITGISLRVLGPLQGPHLDMPHFLSWSSLRPSRSYSLGIWDEPVFGHICPNSPSLTQRNYQTTRYPKTLLGNGIIRYFNVWWVSLSLEQVIIGFFGIEQSMNGR